MLLRSSVPRSNLLLESLSGDLDWFGQVDVNDMLYSIVFVWKTWKTAFHFYKWQGWVFALSLICPSLFRSKSLILKSDHNTLYKRAAWANCYRCSLKKSKLCEWFAHDSSESIAKNKQIAWKIHIFRKFWQFFPKSESLPTLFAHSLLF